MNWKKIESTEDNLGFIILLSTEDSFLIHQLLSTKDSFGVQKLLSSYKSKNEHIYEDNVLYMCFVTIRIVRNIWKKYNPNTLKLYGFKTKFTFYPLQFIGL